jgi:hypothetical protein
MDFVPHWAGWAQSRPFWAAWEGRRRAFDGGPNLVVSGVIGRAVSWCFVKQNREHGVHIVLVLDLILVVT